MHWRCLPLQPLALSRVLRTSRPRAAAAMSSSSSIKPQLLSVAPMMDWTDVHYRQLARLISRHTWLYTEMVVDTTLIHNPNHDKFLLFPPEQHPIVCQLGGSDPTKLAAAAKVVARYGYDEINLNCGCPSDRVAGAGCFGAALMLQPQLVADCCKAVAEAVATNETLSGGPPPVTVKCRIGVDDHDSYEELCAFIKAVSEGSPVTHFIVHARKCHLKGLNPHQNRTIPPLRYEWVVALRRDFPHLEFSLNGGVQSLQEVAAALRLADPAAAPAAEGAAATGGGSSSGSNGGDGGNGSSGSEAEQGASAGAGLPANRAIAGVMVGRAAYNMVWDALGDADRAIFGAESNPAASRRQVLEAYAQYADGVLADHRENPREGWRGPSVRALFKPLLGMFHNEPRGKKWRAAVDTALKTATTVSEALEATLPVLLPETLDAPPKPTLGLGKLQHLGPTLPVAGDSASVPAGKRARTS